MEIEILDQNKYIKVNNLQEITNPVFFSSDGVPTDDGLLSQKIFGITQKDRSGIFGYINLHGWFIDPSYYKAWGKLDSRIKKIVAKEGKWSLSKEGKIVEDPSGKTGLKFLKSIINDIKFENDTGSTRKDFKINHLNNNRDKAFIDKIIVIPPFYRDTNTSNSRKGSAGVSFINQLYQQLIVISKQIETTQEYGYDMSGMQEFRMQEYILSRYDWFCGTSNANIKRLTDLNRNSAGISGKFGVLRSANASKTSDFGGRLVISATNLKVNSPADMEANTDVSRIPLAATIASFEPFVQFHMRQFFEQEFIGNEMYQVITKSGKVEYKIPKDPMIQFSDDTIKNQLRHFIHGYNNRLVPIEIEMEDGSICYMQFKGRYREPNSDVERIYNRKLTWLDVIFMSAVAATENKMVLISRYPIDTRTNQIATKISVSSTNDTEPMYVGENFYKYYPKFTEEDIGKDTSNMFIDTCVMSNLYLIGMGGD
jgi:hypothetical protein